MRDLSILLYWTLFFSFILLQTTKVDSNHVTLNFFNGTLDNVQERRFELFAFPVGFVIGTLGSNIFPFLFGSTTTPPPTPKPGSSSSSNQGLGALGQNTILSDDSSSSSSTGTSSSSFPSRTSLSSFPGCGEKGISTRIIGGEEVVAHEYPWLCSLRFRGSHICGATLISAPPYETIIVGAAHCYDKNDGPKPYTIVCGEHNLRKKDNYEIVLKVTEVIPHSKYFSASRGGYDIAIWKVDDTPLKGKVIPKKLYPVCLPDIKKNYYRQEAIVAGWGVTQTRLIRGSAVEVRALPDVARHVSVTVSICKDNDGFSFPDGLLCAADKGKDSCQGDSGGPLITKSSGSSGDTYEWIGVVSFGVGCAKEGYPGAYTRTTCFMDWIASHFNLKASSSVDSTSWSTKCPGTKRFEAFGDDVVILENRSLNKKQRFLEALTKAHRFSY